MVVWCALCGLTLLSVALMEEGWHRSVASILIVLIAAVKSRLVILHYMEANCALTHWRFLYATWVFAGECDDHHWLCDESWCGLMGH